MTPSSRKRVISNHLEVFVSNGSDFDGKNKRVMATDDYQWRIARGIADGSDTDDDGLSDKEEIETYKSDPLNASSSGDLYSDGYKISHGMDLNKYYEYQNDVIFTQNECPEVFLEAKSASDFNANVKRYNASSTSGS